MSAWLVVVMPALIAGPLMWLLSRFDKRNTEQHGRSMATLDRIESKVDTLDTRLYDHIKDHQAPK